jgi:hypothetical protein
MDRLREDLLDVLRETRPMTVRQVFYQMVARGAVEKSEAAYKGIVGRLLVEMRRDGDIPFGWIADGTRWMRKPETYGGLRDALESAAQFYRRDLWRAQNCYVEIWCEKDALASVVMDETETYDVPLMVSRGYSSLSFLHSAAENIRAIDKPAYIYHLGDHDPAGVDIPAHIERELRQMAPDAEIHFEMLAVTPTQIKTYKLPTRPTKNNDARGKTFKGRSTDLDALPADVLRRIVREAIERHMPREEFWKLKSVEAAERESLKSAFGYLEDEGLIEIEDEE